MKIILPNETFQLQRNKGVYQIKCIVTNKIYIGSTIQSFKKRLSNHIKFLKSNNLQNAILQSDYNKYGSDNFEFSIIEVISNNNEIRNKEQYYIDLLKPEYNNYKKVSQPSKTNTGKKFSKEHKEKLSEKSKLFRHKNLEAIDKQNKEGASKIKVTNLLTNESFICNSNELKNYFNVISSLCKYYNKVYKNHKLELIKEQRKKVVLLIDNSEIVFKSFNECDKYLNKWRGYTSTNILQKCDTLDGYTYKIL